MFCVGALGRIGRYRLNHKHRPQLYESTRKSARKMWICSSTRDASKRNTSSSHHSIPTQTTKSPTTLFPHMAYGTIFTSTSSNSPSFPFSSETCLAFPFNPQPNPPPSFGPARRPSSEGSRSYLFHCVIPSFGILSRRRSGIEGQWSTDSNA